MTGKSTGAVRQLVRRAASTGGAAAIGVACATAKSDAPDQRASSATAVHLEAALAGAPDATTEAAAQTLAPILDAADWYYLTTATWPAEAAAVLADPRLQKAMRPFLGTTASTRSRPTRRDLAPLGNPPATPQIQSLLDQARRLMQQANGAATAAKPTTMLAFVQLLGQSDILVLPVAGEPADRTADTKTVQFYDDGITPPKTANTGYPPCCVGTLTFASGPLLPGMTRDATFVCEDNTSCVGKGEPPPGRITCTCPSRSNSGSVPTPACANVEGGGISVAQCPSGIYEVTCDDGSTPLGCDKSDGYSINGGILCCSSPVK